MLYTWNIAYYQFDSHAKLDNIPWVVVVVSFSLTSIWRNFIRLEIILKALLRFRMKTQILCIMYKQNNGMAYDTLPLSQKK